MRITIDKAGRLVIPKELRDRVGLTAGEVEIHLDGAALRVEPLAADVLVTRGSRLAVPATDRPLDDRAVRALRDADRR